MCICLASLLAAGVPLIASAAPAPPAAARAAANANAFVPGRILVKFKDGIAPNGGKERAALQATGTSVISRMPDLGVAAVRIPLNARESDHLAMLRSRPEVEYAELDEIVAPADVLPNDPMYPYAQWAIQRIECPAAWSTTTGNTGVIVAILDSGVNANHSDLASKMVLGWNMYDNNSNTSDHTGHGTSVAGAAAALSNNAEGIASVAWGCRIMPIRITNSNGNTTFSMTANGLNWARTHGARVANISYAITNSSTVRTAAQAFQNAGGVVVVSAGNAGYLDTTADNPYVLTVSATDSSDIVPTWSNTGNNIDLSAPGVSVQCTSVGGGYASGTGTSFSAPLVAGVAALVASANPSLTGQQVQDVTKLSATDMGSTGWDQRYGFGRLNAAAAVAMAINGPPSAPPPPPPPPPPSDDTTPPAIAITSPANGVNVNGQVNVTVSCSDNVAVTRVELYVDGVLKASKTSAPFTTRWNSNQASHGAHIMLTRAYDAAGNVGESPAITVHR